MGSSERVYRGSIRVISVLLVALGLVILASTLFNGGGPASVGFLLGLAFVAIGAARLWIAARMER